MTLISRRFDARLMFDIKLTARYRTVHEKKATLSFSEPMNNEHTIQTYSLKEEVYLKQNYSGEKCMHLINIVKAFMLRFLARSNVIVISLQMYDSSYNWLVKYSTKYAPIFLI